MPQVLGVAPSLWQGRNRRNTAVPLPSVVPALSPSSVLSFPGQHDGRDPTNMSPPPFALFLSFLLYSISYYSPANSLCSRRWTSIVILNFSISGGWTTGVASCFGLQIIVLPAPMRPPPLHPASVLPADKPGVQSRSPLQPKVHRSRNIPKYTESQLAVAANESWPILTSLKGSCHCRQHAATVPLAGTPRVPCTAAWPAVRVMRFVLCRCRS